MSQKLKYTYQTECFLPCCVQIVHLNGISNVVLRWRDFSCRTKCFQYLGSFWFRSFFMKVRLQWIWRSDGDIITTCFLNPGESLEIAKLCASDKHAGVGTSVLTMTVSTGIDWLRCSVPSSSFNKSKRKRIQFHTLCLLSTPSHLGFLLFGCQALLVL